MRRKACTAFDHPCTRADERVIADASSDVDASCSLPSALRNRALLSAICRAGHNQHMASRAEDLKVDRDADGHIMGVRMLRNDGTTKWEKLPDVGDTVVNVQLVGDEVIMNTWSCWRIRLRTLDGVEIDRTFTK